MSNQPFQLERYQEIEDRLDKLYPNFQYRPNQKEMILAFAYSFLVEGKKWGVINAPVGSGKSVLAKHLCSLIVYFKGVDTLTLTKTIALQNQYLRDFDDMKKLMGASNYDCATSDSGFIPPSRKFHSDCRYTTDSGECHYARARAQYESSKFKILNYAFWLTGIHLYNNRNMLIVDEAHNIEENILEWAKLEINLDTLHRRSEEQINLPLTVIFPNGWSDIKVIDKQVAIPLLEFLTSAYRTSNTMIDELEKQIDEQYQKIEEIEYDENSSSEDKKTAKKLAEVIKAQIEKRLKPLKSYLGYIDGLIKALRRAMSCNFEDYSHDTSIEEGSITYILKPIFCSKALLDTIFKAEHVLFMSGTGERIATSLRLPPEDTIELSSPYLFPIENKPFYVFEFLPSLNHGNFESVFPKYVEVLDGLIEYYPEDACIIVHSHSYKNAEQAIKLSKHSKRMIIPSSEQNRELEKFIKPGDIIVSPSITEGVDLGGNRISAQVFLKCPYPYLGDQWVKDKMKQDEGWYSYQAMLHVIQGSGRAIRGPNDKCDTYFLDSGFRRLLGQNLSLTPLYFKQAIKWVD